MPGWVGSTRRSRLPKNWDEIRTAVLQRDGYACQWYTTSIDNTIVSYCNERANQVDHIIPNDNHSLDNLRSLCAMHHQRKSSIEGAKALAAKRRRLMRKTEPHPGLRE